MDKSNIAKSDQMKMKGELRLAQLRLFEKYFPEDGLGKRPFSLTINKKTVPEVFSLLRDMDSFPKFFENLAKVESSGPNQAQWHFGSGQEGHSMAIPMTFESDEGLGSLFWKTETSAGFDYSVGVFLEPASAGRGTVVRMLVAYDNLAGSILSKFEFLFGKDAMVTSKKNLYRLKAFLETGHVPTTEGQPSGRDEDMPTTMKH